MRSALLALRAAGVAAVLMAAPATAAYAHDSVSIQVTPSTIAPGGEVELRVSDCKGTTGVARSSAFSRGETNLNGKDGRENPLYGEARINSSIGAGTYEISVDCDGHNHNKVGTVTVVHHQPTHQPTQHATPVSPVHAGGGGTAQLASETAEGDGPGTRHTVIGLVLAGVAAVAVAFRSVRRRPTDAD
ncbi:hypothetical protein ABCR94_06130 [Streptomyces sp. 21So2-11]|uniref:hypothetical protein n=1 Tax=Streptomyces sp. 21So2-11 TaxID=3144408 RepID=UPI00321AF6BC